jgi:large subunit ribosomal protein L9
VVFAKREATEKGDAEKQAEVLNGVSLAIARKAGENDQLFGSVTTADISESLAAQGFTIDRRKIQLAEPIKLIGEYQVPIKLHRDIVATVKLTVSREA